MCFRSLYIAAILMKYIQDSRGLLLLSHHNYTIMVGKVGCLVYLAALLVGCLGGSFLKIDISRVVKGERETSGFGLKVMLGGYIFVSGSCTFQISCGDISKIA